MIPLGYMAKRNLKPPQAGYLPGVEDVYSVNDCVNDNFADFVDAWKHNGFWFFNRPQDIRALAHDLAIDLEDTKLFYYEAYDLEFSEEQWRGFLPWNQPGVDVTPPSYKTIEGYDVISVWPENSPDPEHSPLSCNGLAREIKVNKHCLLDTLSEAKSHLEANSFDGCCGHGAWRIVAVYSVEWN